MQLLRNSANFHTREKERPDLASAIFPSRNRPAGRRFSNGRSLRHSGTPKKNGVPYEKHQIPSDAYRGNEPKSREVFRTLLLRRIVSFSVLGLSR